MSINEMDCYSFFSGQESALSSANNIILREIIYEPVLKENNAD